MPASVESAPSFSVPADEIRTELDRVMASTGLQHSPQLQRLLRFLVSETLAGHGDRLKEYVIGVEVFGRPASYDPRLDSLVRVEVRRLRGALDLYYAGPGQRDPVVIELNKGGYQPAFRARTPEQSPLGPRRRRTLWLLLLLVAVVGAVVAFRYRKASPTVSLPRSLAVLPFDNLSRDPENEYLCFGLVDQVTTELAKTPGLRIVARTSASRFSRSDDIRTIANRLRVEAVLEGSVRKSGDKVLVTAQLINAADSSHLWSETYERSNPDLIHVQDELAQAVAREVQARLAVDRSKVPPRIRASMSPEAQQLYWKGAYLRVPMGHANWRSELARSAQYFEQAVEKDPGFALAYAALADIYVSLAWERGGGEVTRDFMMRGQQAALRALELNDSLPEAYGALGTIQFFYDYEPAAAERSFRRALLLDPNNGKARMWYAYALVMQRRFDEAIAQARQARELDPMSYISTTHLAVVTYFAGHNDEAITLVRQTLEVADIAPAHGLLGMAYEVQRNYPAAIAQYKAGLRLVPNHAYIKGMLGHAYAMSGQRKEAVALLRDAGLPFESGGLSGLKTAYIYVALGDYDRAFDNLEREYQLRNPELPYVNADPVFNPVRYDPRFVALLRKLGLAS